MAIEEGGKQHLDPGLGAGFAADQAARLDLRIVGDLDGTQYHLVAAVDLGQQPLSMRARAGAEERGDLGG